MSAGNFNGSENPEVPKESWRDEYSEYLISPASVLIDPAPALNAITSRDLSLPFTYLWSIRRINALFAQVQR